MKIVIELRVLFLDHNWLVIDNPVCRLILLCTTQACRKHCTAMTLLLVGDFAGQYLKLYVSAVDSWGLR